MLKKEQLIDWDNLPTHKKRGSCVFRTQGNVVIEKDIPLFKEDRGYIDGFLCREE